MGIPRRIKASETRQQLLRDVEATTWPNGWLGQKLLNAGGFAKIGDIVRGLPTVEEVNAYVEQHGGWKDDYVNMPQYFVDAKVPSVRLTFDVPEHWFALADHFGIKYPMMSVFIAMPLMGLIHHVDSLRLHRVRQDYNIPPEMKLPFDRLMIPLQDWVPGQQVSVMVPDATGVERVCHYDSWKRGEIRFTRTTLYRHWSANSNTQLRYTMYVTGLFTKKTWDLVDSEVQQEVDISC